jgi:hypothetical protein
MLKFLAQSEQLSPLGLKGMFSYLYITFSIRILEFQPYISEFSECISKLFFYLYRTPKIFIRKILLLL